MRADNAGNELGSSDLDVEMEHDEEEEMDNLSAVKEEEVVGEQEQGSDGEDVQVSVKKKPFSRTTASPTYKKNVIKQDIKQEKSGKHDLNGTKVLPKEKKTKRQPLRK